MTGTTKRRHRGFLSQARTPSEVQVFHESFPNFLQDRDRCSETRFFNDSASQHADMALGCLMLSKPNSCSLPNFWMNRDVPNLLELLGDKDAVRTPLLYDRVLEE